MQKQKRKQKRGRPAESKNKDKNLKPPPSIKSPPLRGAAPRRPDAPTPRRPEASFPEISGQAIISLRRNRTAAWNAHLSPLLPPSPLSSLFRSSLPDYLEIGTASSWVFSIRRLSDDKTSNQRRPGPKFKPATIKTPVKPAKPGEASFDLVTGGAPYLRPEEGRVYWFEPKASEAELKRLAADVWARLYPNADLDCRMMRGTVQIDSTNRGVYALPVIWTQLFGMRD
ncbi:hypothetical protein GE09DRAFT_1213437 [Coniochaeta sp. 2T2.1]|nr:hypothetical protein GE09DRAFT_1213437 [Coniochaeta sp. 2T2.1]